MRRDFIFFFFMLFIVITDVSAQSKGSRKQCAHNEVWTTCSTCEATCFEPPTACAAVCGPPSCQCPRSKGFVRDASGLCVQKWQCKRPGKTTPNPASTTTTTPWFTPKTCGTVFCPPGQICVMRQLKCPRRGHCRQVPVCLNRDHPDVKKGDGGR